jgi:hypothetical protein
MCAPLIFTFTVFFVLLSSFILNACQYFLVLLFINPSAPNDAYAALQGAGFSSQQHSICAANYGLSGTGRPQFAPVQFAPIQSNADFETRRSKSEKNIFYYYL